MSAPPHQSDSGSGGGISAFAAGIVAVTLALGTAFAMRSWCASDCSARLLTEERRILQVQTELGEARAIIAELEEAAAANRGSSCPELQFQGALRQDVLPAEPSPMSDADDRSSAASAQPLPGSETISRVAGQAGEHEVKDVFPAEASPRSAPADAAPRGQAPIGIIPVAREDNSSALKPPLGWEAISRAAANSEEHKAKEVAIQEESRLEARGLSPKTRPKVPLPAIGFVPRPRNELGIRADGLDRLVAGLYAKRGYTLERSGQQSRILQGLRTGAAAEQADVELFVRLCAEVRPRRIFGIGNAFGYSSLLLSYACNNAPVDVLDAEQEGDANRLGTELTRKIAMEEGRNIRVFVGFSPQQTGDAMREHNGTYDLALIDGLHLDHRLLLDFLSLRGSLGPSPVVIFHDAGYFHMWQAVRKVLRAQPTAKYRTFHSSWAQNFLGTGFAYWGDRTAAFEGWGPLFDPRRSPRPGLS